MSKSATSHDVARVAGVSRTTVSYVLNNSGSAKISEETRQKVIEAAQKVGYFPNRAAKAIKTGRFGCLALLLGREIYLPKNLLLGINETVAAEDIHLSVASLYRGAVTEENGPAFLRHLIADGILVNSNEDVVPQADEIKRGRKMPLIWLNRKLKSNCIYPDDSQAAFNATSELIAMGHRKTMYVYCGRKSQHFSVTARLQGYEKAMKKAGLQARSYSTHKKITDNQTHLRELCSALTAKDCPTAILCYSTPSAIAVHTAALLCRLSIPKDLSLLMFEDENKELGTGYKVGTIPIPWKQIGIAAVTQTLQALDAPECNTPAMAIPYGPMDTGESCVPLPEGRS